MDVNLCSNQEIHLLLEHGSECAKTAILVKIALPIAVFSHYQMDVNLSSNQEVQLFFIMAFYLKILRMSHDLFV